MSIRNTLSSMTACALAIAAAPLVAQDAPPVEALSYADLATLADGAPLVVRAQIRKQTPVPAERAPGLAAGHARLYIEARTMALLSGDAPLGETLTYLVDVPTDAKGKPPKLKKREVLLFARTVPGRSGELQLLGPAAQQPYSPETEARLRPILAELLAADAPPRITGIRDALAVQGNLTGESETQIFLATAEGDPATITVARRPGAEPMWGVSWSEIVDQSARAPQTNTLEWYRLACSLPSRLPAEANLAQDPAARSLAARDYALVLQALGPCRRSGTAATAQAQ